MSESQATVNIPRDVLEPIVRQQVAAGIIAAMGDPTEIVTELVSQSFNRKVDSVGKVSQYSCDNKYSMIEVVCRKAIDKVVQECIQEFVEVQRKAIKENVEKALARRNSAVARALVDGLVEYAKKARFDISMVPPPRH